MKCPNCRSERGIRTTASGIGTRIMCTACGYDEYSPEYIR